MNKPGLCDGLIVGFILVCALANMNRHPGIAIIFAFLAGALTSLNIVQYVLATTTSDEE